jgi:hypothetical protein
MLGSRSLCKLSSDTHQTKELSLKLNPSFATKHKIFLIISTNLLTNVHYCSNFERLKSYNFTIKNSV